METELTLDARAIPPRERHPQIFKTWEELPVGGAIRLLNDHDPKPLYYEFEAERAGEFEWTPLDHGPELWSVLIRRVGAAKKGGPVSLNQTVYEVTSRWPRTQAVLARYGLDMCCGGAHPIEFAARAHRVDARQLLRELNLAAEEAPEPERPSWAKRPPDAEIDVREDLRAGRDPFHRVLEASARMSEGQVLKARSLFKGNIRGNVLLAGLKPFGFERWAHHLGGEDWELYFIKRGR